MIQKLNSYKAGSYDVYYKFELLSMSNYVDVLGELNFIYPNEDTGELDAFEYLRGKVDALEHILQTIKDLTLKNL